jgi:hypothetical protein
MMRAYSIARRITSCSVSRTIIFSPLSQHTSVSGVLSM